MVLAEGYLAYQGGCGTGLEVIGMACILWMICRALGRFLESSSMQSSIREATSCGHSSGTLHPNDTYSGSTHTCHEYTPLQHFQIAGGEARDIICGKRTGLPSRLCQL